MKIFTALKPRIYNNVILFIILAVYIIAMLVIIQWGIPNPQRPFPIFMDEWHQLRGVATLAKVGSNNVPGSGHGTMLHFILSGIYLVPFYLLHIIHPNNLKHNLSTQALTEYNHIFIILRVFIILFGVGTMLLMYKIAKCLKVNPLLSVFLLFATPAFISWSNYYKYEIPVLFWITCSILFLLLYKEKPTRKRFVLASIVCGLAFSTKVSALPLLPLLVIGFLLFTPQIKKIKKHLATFIWGIFFYIATVCLVGIPDVLLGKGDYGGFLSDSFISGPQGSTNFILNSVQSHLFYFEQIPFDFGFGVAVLLFFALIYYGVVLVKAVRNKKLHKYKTEIFLLAGFFIFLISFIPVKYLITSNRMLVILPFTVFLIMIALQKSLSKKYNVLFAFVIFLIVCLQTFQTFTVYSIKLAPDHRVTSSEWIVKHIPYGSTIGLVNIPIYQMYPDIILKDFYSQQYKNNKGLYKYVIIDEKNKNLPKFIILTNADYENKYLKMSIKKDILKRMGYEHYKLIATFSPYLQLYNLFGDESDLNLSGLLSFWPITIYERISQ